MTPCDQLWPLKIGLSLSRSHRLNWHTNTPMVVYVVISLLVVAGYLPSYWQAHSARRLVQFRPITFAVTPLNHHHHLHLFPLCTLRVWMHLVGLAVSLVRARMIFPQATNCSSNYLSTHEGLFCSDNVRAATTTCPKHPTVVYLYDRIKSQCHLAKYIRAHVDTVQLVIELWFALVFSYFPFSSIT